MQEKPSSSQPSAPVENPDNAETQVWTDLTPHGDDAKANTTAALLDKDKRKPGEEAEEEKITDDELVENVEGHEDPFVAADGKQDDESASEECGDGDLDGVPLEEGGEEEEKENDKEQDDDPDVANDNAGQKTFEGGAHKDAAFQYGLTTDTWQLGFAGTDLSFRKVLLFQM